MINLVGDLNAAALTGTLDVTTTDVTGAGTISVATGTAATTITSGALVSGGIVDTIVVDASALADDALLTLVGPANFTVTGLKGDLDVSGATGTVTIADAPTIIITTSGDGISSIDASAFADNHTLVLIGSDNTTVTGLKGDLDASGLTGTLSITTADIADAGDIGITTGSNTTTITSGALASGGTADAISVNATTLADDTLLTLVGPANFTVSGLQGDLDAAALTGTLTVTTAAVPGLTIATGNGDNIIHAEALIDNQVLTLTGNDAATVALNFGDLTAPSERRTHRHHRRHRRQHQHHRHRIQHHLDHRHRRRRRHPVNAAALPDDTSLTLVGAAAVTVTNLVGDLDASALSGDLSVTTTDNVDASDIGITTGCNATTITSGALASGGTADAISVNATRSPTTPADPGRPGRFHRQRPAGRPQRRRADRHAHRHHHRRPRARRSPPATATTASTPRR